MKFEQLKVLLIVAESGSFSKASEHLFISKQALLKQITSLEAELGFALFNRSSKGVNLTEAGQYLYTESKKLLGKWDSVVDNCCAIAAKHNIIRIANPTHPRLVLEKAIEHFALKYPEVQQEIVYISPTDNPIDGLLNNLFDICALTTHPEYNVDGIDSTPIGVHSTYCLMTKTNPLAKHKSVSLEDIAHCRIGVNKIGRKMDIIQALQAMNPNVDVVQCVGDEPQFIFNMCFTGGVYISKAYYAKSMPPLAAIPIRPDFPDYISLFYREKPSGILIKFIEQVKTIYHEDQP